MVRCPNCGQKTSGDHCQYCKYPIVKGMAARRRKAEKQAKKQKAGRKVLATLAPLYQRQSRYEESARVYRRLVELAPGQSSNWLGLAVSLEALNRQEEAVVAYKRALLNGNLSTVLQQYAEQRINQYR